MGNSDFGRIAELQNGVDTHLHPQSLLFQDIKRQTKNADISAKDNQKRKQNLTQR